MIYFNKKLIISICFFMLLSSSLVRSENAYQGSSTIFIPYANGKRNWNLDESPTINIGFNGNPQYVPFVMDTGSVGIIASSDHFTPAPGAKNLGPGQQLYTSSGIIEEGTWWSATQEIYDANGQLLAITNTPVLQITSVKCKENARFCTARKHPKGIAMMGIGFGRESSHQPRGTPEYNPFLNLATILPHGVLTKLPLNWSNGYVVTPTGIFLGLTSSNTANAGFVKLTPWLKYSTQKLNEWMPTTMTVKANGITGNGNILMDTGVGTGYFSPPKGANFGQLIACKKGSKIECIANGNAIKIYLPDDKNPVASYSFIVGDSGNAMQPKGIHVVKNSNVFLNTSRHVLAGMNYIYDNTNGYVGYALNSEKGANLGIVKEATVPTVTTLSSSKTPAIHSETITFTATVAQVNNSTILTGSVTFMIDNKIIQYVVLDNKGEAFLSTSELKVGSHQIVAKYSGDSVRIRSNSKVFIQNIDLKP